MLLHTHNAKIDQQTRGLQKSNVCPTNKTVKGPRQEIKYTEDEENTVFGLAKVCGCYTHEQVFCMMQQYVSVLLMHSG